MHSQKMRGANWVPIRPSLAKWKARRSQDRPRVYGRVGAGMTKLDVLTPRERVRQDGETIAAIYRNLGTSLAEQMVARALGELALAMAGIAAQVRAHELADLARQLKKLQRMAEGLGMVSLAAVATDARICLERSDSTGFAAVWARLMRVAECSLAPEQGSAGFSG
jgi:hypothetical protein